ncbi:molybdopterin cofactor-binding domain-containing protein [Flavivirga sp. 57AJ16]|uniref:xanthine dehydrogenase family protein molybdopterin-binding subunit n=1 Tax=Flavivirga sp. 57AJ16 TaxID=3025307 RepID=UPI002366EB2B|nr:molybdopterin cofactor-binding domain-containing protein [Flavivirga sp. 57AJ16]MDD7887285.1 molybdopterin-dependent oxidoreductase [Flavivirga sp. 57AJ16]
MNLSKQQTFSRRSFLKTSALASGGMLISFNLFTACKSDVRPPIDISQLNFNDFNAFIKISDEGKVTIFSPNPEIGQGVKTAMPMLIAEELDVLWEDVYVQQGNLDTENYARQVAGGSQSIRSSWEPLRQTGATAKQMLVNAAAAKWGVSASECKASQGVITNAKGEKLGYGDVVKEAALLEVPEDVKLKDPKDFTIIGKDIGNVDLDKIVTGKPLFGLDYKEEGMVYASVLRPPAFGQVLESFDDTDARHVNGVVDVIKFGDKIAVLATSTWAAMKGKKVLKAEWKQDSEAESTAFHNEELLKILNGNKFDTRRKDGHVKKAFAEADKVLERIYESPFLPHNCMEPMNFFAHVTKEKINLVGPIQTPKWTADRVAELLDRDVSEVSLKMTRMGGGFGRRLYGDFALEAAEVSNSAKKPVKVVFSREDDMCAGTYRPATKYKIAASIKDGKLTGYHLKEAAINGNMYGLIPNFFPAAALDNYQVDTANYKSNITTGAWRAPYTNFLASAEQCFFDELAEVMEVDRIQLHLDLLENVKSNPEPNIEYSPERLQGVIKMVVDKSNWGKTEAGVYQGFSVYYCHNTHVAEVADIVMENGNPIVKKVTCAVDCGIVVNPLGAINQIKGGIIDGIGHALYGELVFKDGVPQSNNFNSYQLIRMGQTPQIDVHFVKSDVAPTGLGEPTLPPAGAAVANAIYKATGKRLTKQPYIDNMDLEKVVG